MGTKSRLKAVARRSTGRVRRITFADDADGRKQFGILYTGFTLGAQHQTKRPVDTQALEADIYRTLAAISDERDGGRVLDDGLQIAEFTEAEWAVLTRYFDAPEIQWPIAWMPAVVELRATMRETEPSEEA